MTPDALADAMGRRAGVNYAALLPGCEQAMHLGNITTVNRAAMWLAQLGAESGGLQWATELADGSEYNGRADLGNTQPGDGPRFKGRGWIQLTGRSNYGRFSDWAHSNALCQTPDYFVLNPDQVAGPVMAWMSSLWYWTVARSTLNSLADAGDILGATQAINGGTNGLDGRTQRWRHCLTLGAQILPAQLTSEDDFMGYTPSELQEVLRAARTTNAALSVSRLQHQYNLIVQIQTALGHLQQAVAASSASEASQMQAIMAKVGAA